MIRSGIAVVLAVALVGCGSSTTSDVDADDERVSAQSRTTPEAAPQAVKPASGRTLSTKGLSLTLPRGWADITPDAPDGVLLSGADLGADENPAMVIVRQAAGAPGEARAESTGIAVLEADGAKKVRTMERLEVAGRAATHVRGVRSGGGVNVMLDQFTLLADSSAWVITFSTNRWQVDKDRQRMIDSVLATVAFG